jgi:hypothetical protein
MQTGSRFSDMKALDTVVTDAALTSNKTPSSTTKEKAKKKNIVIYNVDGTLYDVIDQTGESFSSYAKRAILKMAKEDELL